MDKVMELSKQLQHSEAVKIVVQENEGQWCSAGARGRERCMEEAEVKTSCQNSLRERTPQYHLLCLKADQRRKECLINQLLPRPRII